MLSIRGTIEIIAIKVFSWTFDGVFFKSDVYSYDMLSLKIISRKQNYDTEDHPLVNVHLILDLYESWVN